MFGHLVPRATLVAGRTFIERYYKRCYSKTGSAVVAREYGLPAVVNVHDAMRNIRDGDDLQVDGDAGRVSRRRGDAAMR